MSRDLPRVEAVFAKELAHSTGLSYKTILERMHRWDRDPSDPLGIPFLKQFGKPYRVSREVALQFCGQSPAV